MINLADVPTIDAALGLIFTMDSGRAYAPNSSIRFSTTKAVIILVREATYRLWSSFLPKSICYFLRSTTTHELADTIGAGVSVIKFFYVCLNSVEEGLSYLG